MESFVFVYILYCVIVLLILCFVISFKIWMIKKGVKNALAEIIDEDVFYDNIKFSVAEGVLLALEQYNNGNQKERPTE